MKMASSADSPLGVSDGHYCKKRLAIKRCGNGKKERWINCNHVILNHLEGRSVTVDIENIDIKVQFV
jgi:hypothetical protein